MCKIFDILCLQEITDAEWFYISQYRTEAGPITVDQLRTKSLLHPVPCVLEWFFVQVICMKLSKSMTQRWYGKKIWKVIIRQLLCCRQKITRFSGWTRLGEVQELSSFAEDMQVFRRTRHMCGIKFKFPCVYLGQVKLKESQEKANGADGPSTENKKKKKKKKNNKKRKWVEKKDHSNVYVTGLPKVRKVMQRRRKKTQLLWRFHLQDITVQELYDFMKKAGVIADDSAGSPKIKIYTDDEGTHRPFSSAHS